MVKNDVIIEENTEKKVEQKGPFLKGLAIVLFSLLSLFFPPWYIVMIPLFFFMVLWFLWAPNMIIGIFIPEGYSAIVTRGQENGLFVKTMISYKGHKLDKNGRVVEEIKDDESDKPGWLKRITDMKFGMQLFWWPFDRIHSYNLEWKQYNQDEKVVHRKEHLYYILLKIYAYLIEISRAEDRDKVPQDVRLVVPMQVVHPYKAVFKVQNWYRIVSNIIIGILRDFVRTKSYEELINTPRESLNEQIGQKIQEKAQEIEDNYGIKIFWDRVVVVQIGPADEEYARATLQAIIAQKKAEAIKIEAGAEAYKRSTETMGLAMAMLARFVGEEEKQLSALFRKHPREFERKYGKRFGECLDLVQRAMALEKGKLVDIRSPDAKGGTSDLLSIIMASKLIDSGSGGNKSPATAEKSEGKRGKIFDEETAKNLKKAGIPVELQDEV